MSFQYRSLVRSLWSLRGDPHTSDLVPTERAVAYRSHARGIAPLADIYVPPRPTGASAVLVHGGAFVIGSRRMKPMRYLATRLVDAGITVCAIDYRMIFRGGGLGEATDDVCAALDFWIARAPDPRAISVVGLSAGATLSLLAAGRTPVARVVSCFGLYDVDHLQGPLTSLWPRLLFRTRDRDAWHARAPRHAAQPAAPTLLLHGTEDGLVPVAQAHALAAHRETLGLPTRLVVYDGAPHGFFNAPCAAADAATTEIIVHVTGVAGIRAA